MTGPSPLYEALWNAMPSPALVIGADGTIALANPAAELFFATSIATLKRRTLRDLLGVTSASLGLVEQCRSSGASVSAYAVPLILSDLGVAGLGVAGLGVARETRETQEPQIIDLQATPLHDGSGAILLMIRPHPSTAQFGRALCSQAASRSLAGLTSVLAHEIKNPLAGISGAVQLIEQNLNAEDLTLCAIVQEEVSRIRDLLDRIDAFGDFGPVTRGPVNLHDVLDQARRAALAGFGRHVRFVENYDPSLPPADGDRGQLLQAISNLIKNAVEACPQQGGEVRLRTAYRPGVRVTGVAGTRTQTPLEITISDNGDGVPETLLAHIFEPFVSSKASGAGLGLSLVAKIITDHGGVINYRRRRERTEFRILLSVWRDEKEDAR
jgi:two-component system nitrogen regulation sensor histidine kinase GlnL